MRTTIFVAFGRQSIFNASANDAVTYKLNRKVSTADSTSNPVDKSTYRFRAVTAATGE